MIRSTLARSTAPVAAVARPCTSGSGIGYLWRDLSAANQHRMNATFAATTKPTARHLGMATT